MLTVAGGFILGSSDLYQDWDPTLSLNPNAAAQDNRGCAPGWATIYVQDSLTGGTVKICRRLDAAILGSGGAAIINEETSPNWRDEATINVASAAEEVVTAVGGALPSTWSMAALLIGAAVLLFAWKK